MEHSILDAPVSKPRLLGRVTVWLDQWASACLAASLPVPFVPIEEHHSAPETSPGPRGGSCVSVITQLRNSLMQDVHTFTVGF